MSNWALSSLLFQCFLLIQAHQNPQFPGSRDANKPPETHHQGQMHKQPPPAQANTPHKGTHDFGGQEAHDAEHIKEHLDGKIDPTANMTAEQLQFHYFKMHDVDQNNKLDGTELIKAITHFHDENSNQPDQPPPPALTDIDIERMLDPIFESDDINRDGFISYAEFSKAQKLREDQARMQKPQEGSQSL